MSDTADADSSLGRKPTGDEITLPPNTREKVLKRDGYRCVLCNAESAEMAGEATLQVHHAEYDPEHCDVNDMANLTTLCTVCHSWMHGMPDPDDLSIELTKKAIHRLVGGDFEILEILVEDGPMSAKRIAAQAAHNPDIQTVKQRLYAIMGVDTIVDEQPQIVDKDAETGRWGLPEDVETSERQDPQTIYDTVKRTRDKIVQSAMEQGYDQELIADIVGIDKRQCYVCLHRARAYDFDLDKFTGPGRPPKDGGGTVEHHPTTTTRESSPAEGCSNDDADNGSDTTNSDSVGATDRTNGTNGNGGIINR
jgi:hypothetical protein